MPLASGTRVQVTYVKEVERGVTPDTPSMKKLRLTGRNINLNKNMLESTEVRADRQKADVRHGMHNVGGSLGFELMVSGFDDFLEGLFGGTFSNSVSLHTTVIGSHGNLTVTATSSTITRATGNFTTDGVAVGMVVTISDFVNGGNNGTFVVATVGTTTITVTGMTGVDEGPVAATIAVSHAYGTLAVSASASTFTRSVGDFGTDGVLPGMVVHTSGFSNSENNGTFVVTHVGTTAITVLGMLHDEGAAIRTMALVGKFLKVGTDLTTFTVERAFLDVDQYQVFRGVAMNQMNLKIQPSAIIGGTIDVIGMAADPLSGDSLDDTPSDACTNSPLDSFDGVICENGVAIGVVTGIDLTINNNRSLGAVVGSKESPDVFDGTMDATGTITVYFEDEAMFNRFANEEESSMFLLLSDLNGTDSFAVGFPRIKYTGGTMDPPQNGPIVLTMPFRALVDAIAKSCVTINQVAD